MDEINRVRQFIGMLTMTICNMRGHRLVYRGESRQHNAVSSSLFRYFNELDDGLFDIMEAQQRQLQRARAYARDASDTELLAQIQHRGGKTNLIDFSSDLNVALFFASYYNQDEDGRIIIFKIDQWKHYTILRAGEPSNMADAQKSYFVVPSRGYISDTDVLVFDLPSTIKPDIVDYLGRVHGIEAPTIYNDISGFIRDQQLFPDHEADFYTGQHYARSGDFEKAIEHYSRYLENPVTLFRRGLAYYHRGLVHWHMEDFQNAWADIRKYESSQWPDKPSLPTKVKDWFDKYDRRQRRLDDRSEGSKSLDQVHGESQVHRIGLSVTDSKSHRHGGVAFAVTGEHGYHFEQVIPDEEIWITLPSHCYGTKFWYWFRHDGYRSINSLERSMGDSFEATLVPKARDSGEPNLRIQVTHQIVRIP